MPRDPRPHVARRRVRRLLATQDQVVPADLRNRLAQRVRGRHGIRAPEDPIREEDPAVRAHRDGPLEGLVEGRRTHGEDDDLRSVCVLHAEGDLQGVRVRRVDLARHADALQGLGLRVDLEFLRLRDLLDAYDDPHRPVPVSGRHRRGGHIERAPARRSRRSLSVGTSPDFAPSRTTSMSRGCPVPSTRYTRSAMSMRSRGDTSNRRSFFRYSGAREKRSRSVVTWRLRNEASYPARFAAVMPPAAFAASAASPAAIPEAIARSTPRNVYPLLIRKPAASPTTRTPSATSRGIMFAPSSGTRCALYPTPFPPFSSRWIAGCMRNFVWTSSIGIFFRPRSSEETTSPNDTDPRFVYRKPPPRSPRDACPAYTWAAPSASPRPNRSWIVSGGSSIVSFTPTLTSRGSRSALSPARRTRVDVAPSAMTTRSDATRSPRAATTPRTPPDSRHRASTRMPVTSVAPASSG